MMSRPENPENSLSHVPKVSVKHLLVSAFSSPVDNGKGKPAHLETHHDKKPLAGGSLTQTQTSNLCNRCQNIFDHWPQVSKEEKRNSPEKFPSCPHWESHYALQLSAQSGCNLCAQFMQGFHEIQPYYDFDNKDNEGPRLSRGIVRIWAGYTMWPEDYWQLQLYLPYSGLDPEYIAWNEEESVCMKFLVNLVPTIKQGKHLLTSSFRLCQTYRNQ
jgi:hypothetical protein